MNITLCGHALKYISREIMLRKLPVLLCMITCLAAVVFGQDREYATIRGFVYDAANGEALIGANVYLDNTQIGSSTNSSGYFVIPHIPVGAYSLIAHYLGYKIYKQEILLAAGDEKKINSIRLEAENLVTTEVVVTGEATSAAEKLYEKELSKIELSSRQINQIPQVAEADLLRSLQTLPGVLPVSDFSSALYVRGGTPDQNLYLMDGTDVYNPEHAFGLFSTFNTDAIKQIELFKGGFGAKYGGRLSSVLNVTNLDGNREHVAGTAALSTLSAKTTIQMPMGRIGSLSGSLRRTYFDQTVARFVSGVPDYYFFDGNLKAFFDLDDKNKLTISGYGSTDKLYYIFNENAKDEVGMRYNWGNRTGSIRWTRILSPQLFANFWLTGSRFNSDADFSQLFDYVFTEKNFISDLSFKGDLEYYLSDAFTAELGFEQKNLHLIFKHQSQGGLIDIERRPKHYAAYVSGNWHPSPRWDFEAGLRYNLFAGEENYKNAEPRFAAKYRLNEAFSLKAAAGTYYQYLHSVPKAFIADNWVSSDRTLRESSANHAILGISKDFSGSYLIEIEAFYKDYHNVYTFNDNFRVDITPERYEGDLAVYTQTDGIFHRGDGNSRGIELLLRKELGVVTGWLGYSLSRTEYKFDHVNQGAAFPPRHDRTHVINLVGNLDWKNFRRALRGEAPVQHRSNWRIGAMFVYMSGQPITLPGSHYFVNTMPDWDFQSPEVYPSTINGFRLPPYIRLDLSLTYEKHYKNWSMSPYLQIFNVGYRKNVWYVDYDAVPTSSGATLNPVIDPVDMFPILPTIGVGFQF